MKETVNSNIKYNSFISTSKYSPPRTKSTERMIKKSQRKLDINNTKKSSCGKRKKSASSKGKAQVTIPTHCKNKVSYQKLTRNPSKAEGFETGYGALLDNKTETLSRRRKDLK